MTSPTVQEVCALAKQHLGQDDPQMVQIVLCAAVSVYDSGDPFWPMLVGPSSAGKSTISYLTRNLATTLDDPTLAGLLSVNHDGEPVGALIRGGHRPFFTIPDFSTILAMSNRGVRDALFAHFRKIYDGFTSRDLGKGQHVEWEGKATILACCTSAIDTYANYQAELGTRFVYFRIEGRSVEDKLARLRQSRSRLLNMNSVQTAAYNLVQRASTRLPDISPSDDLESLIDAASILCCIGRTSVPRDYRHEICGHHETEEPFRVRNQLGVIIRTALALGMDENSAAALAIRVALDSMPITRKLVMRALYEGVLPLSSAEVTVACKGTWTVIKRALEDLHLSGFVSREKGLLDEGDKWCITPSFYTLTSNVFNGFSLSSLTFPSPTPPLKGQEEMAHDE